MTTSGMDSFCALALAFGRERGRRVPPPCRISASGGARSHARVTVCTRTSTAATGPCSPRTPASTAGSSPPCAPPRSTAGRAARSCRPSGRTCGSTRRRRRPRRPGSGPASAAGPTPRPGRRSGTPAPTCRRRAMRLIADGVIDRDGVAGLALHLGYSTRQIERHLLAEVGAGPLALARAQRAQTARLLIETTALPMARWRSPPGSPASASSTTPCARCSPSRPPSCACEAPSAAPGRRPRRRRHAAPPFRAPLAPTTSFGHLAALRCRGWRSSATAPTAAPFACPTATASSPCAPTRITSAASSPRGPTGT